MISDVLSEAVSQIDGYLKDMPDVYAGKMRTKILTLRGQMDSIRKELDTPPRTKRRKIN